jgi:hypothetical protein
MDMPHSGSGFDRGGRPGDADHGGAANISPIAMRPIPTDRAITRSLGPQAYLGRRTSRTFRTYNFSARIGLPSSDRRQRARLIKWPLSVGIGARIPWNPQSGDKHSPSPLQDRPGGTGRKIGVPFRRPRHCPFAAVEQWRTRSGIAQGPLFRSVHQHSVISHRRPSGEAVSLVIKERVSAVGFDPSGYSGHSLRAGLATSAAQSGASAWKIRQQTGHASDAMLIRYIRDGELFTDNVAGMLL